MKSKHLFVEPCILYHAAKHRNYHVWIIYKWHRDRRDSFPDTRGNEIQDAQYMYNIPLESCMPRKTTSSSTSPQEQRTYQRLSMRSRARLNQVFNCVKTYYTQFPREVKMCKTNLDDRCLDRTDN